MPGPEVITFGCRLNIAESEAMKALAGDDPNLVIINSCAVTGEAVRQARQAIRRTKRERPDARIVVTGCGAQTDPALFAAMPEVDSVLGNREKLEPAAFAPSGEKVRVSDIMAVRETAPHMVSAFADHTPRIRGSAEWLRPSLHLLHHPLWPGQQPLGACGRGDRPCEGAGR
jgi:threonylcarbamoyladenosine tRNA methylthiotransferase MtaB